MVSSHLRLLPVRALQFAPHQQIESLVRAAQFHIGLERDRVISLHQRIQQLVHGNGLLVLKSFVKILALQQLRNRVLRHQADEIVGAKLPKPSPVEVDHSFLRIENLENLRLISFGIFLNLPARQRRPRGRASRGVTNHAGEITDQENCGVPEILKMFQLAQYNRVPEVQVGSRRVHAQLYPERLARGARLFQLRPQSRTRE